MMEHTCQGMTLGDHSKAICTICGADLSKATFNELIEAIERVRELHRPTADGRSCIECSRIICLGTSNGLGGMQYPCLTIAMLNGFANEA